MPQEVFLFDDTLKNNICIPGVDKINEKLLKRVIKEADLEKFVNKLPGGLNTKVGKEVLKCLVAKNKELELRDLFIMKQIF